MVNDNNSNDQWMSRKEYRKKHHIPEPDVEPALKKDHHPLNRPKLSPSDKSLRLKRRLDIAIVILVILIIITYGILYFVN